MDLNETPNDQINSDTNHNSNNDLDKEDNNLSEYSVINEGKADIIQQSYVFYNRVQEFNRDLRYLFIYILIDGNQEVFK